MNRFHVIILIVSTSSSFVVESQRNFSELLDSITSSNETTKTTTESPSLDSVTKIYPKQRSQARFEVREKYNALLAELENSVYDGEDYYEDISGSGDDYYFDYEEILEGSSDEGTKFPELALLLSNTDEFFRADDRFKSREDSIKRKRRVRRNTLPFPKHHRMDRVGYRPPHYMEGVDFTLETVFGLPMAEYYVSRYGVHSPMDTMPSHHEAPADAIYTVESSYKEPPMTHHSPTKSVYASPEPKYKEPVYQEPAKPVYHEPAKPEYHIPEPPKYRTPDYHEPPKLDYISPSKPKYAAPDYHDPQVDYRSPKKPGIILPVKKKASGYEEEEDEYYDVTPKYQTPIYYSSKSAPFLQGKSGLRRRRPQKSGSSPEENGYAVYYLPYDQYVLEYPDYGLNPRIPTLPGNAHFLVASPHRPPSLAGKRRKRSVVEGPKVSTSSRSRRNNHAKKLGGLLQKFTSSILHPKRSFKKKRVRNQLTPSQAHHPSSPPSLSFPLDTSSSPSSGNDNNTPPTTTYVLNPGDSSKTTIITFQNQPKLTGITTFKAQGSYFPSSNRESFPKTPSSSQFSSLLPSNNNFNSFLGSSPSYTSINSLPSVASFSSSPINSGSFTSGPSYSLANGNVNPSPIYTSRPQKSSFISTSSSIQNGAGGYYYSSSNPSNSFASSNVNSSPIYISRPQGSSLFSTSSSIQNGAGGYSSSSTPSYSLANSNVNSSPIYTSRPREGSFISTSSSFQSGSGGYSSSSNPFIRSSSAVAVTSPSDTPAAPSTSTVSTTAPTITTEASNEDPSASSDNKLESARRILEDLSSGEIRRVLRQVDFEDDLERSIIEGKWIIKRKRKSDSSFEEDVSSQSSFLQQINKLKRISVNIERILSDMENTIRRRGSVSLVDFRLLRALKRKEKKVDTLIALLSQRDSEDERSVEKVLASLRESGIRHPSGRPWSFNLVRTFLRELDSRSKDGNKENQEERTNEKEAKVRKDALIRASEKQQLIISNLSDAIRRQKIYNESSELAVVESFLSTQSNALDSFKTSVVSLDEKSSTEDRLNFLEDTSHRQLEILEFLMDTVSDLQNKSTESLEKIAQLEDLIRKKSVLSSSSTTESSETEQERRRDIKEILRRAKAKKKAPKKEEEKGKNGSEQDLDTSPSSRLTLEQTSVDPSNRAGTWYRRFYDNYRLSLLQKRIRTGN